jgi:uracil-DNA glycosylase family 4
MGTLVDINTSRRTLTQGYPIQCPPTIKPGALITFCGEAPGWQEVLAKEGFVGGSGKILDKMCTNVGIDLSKCNKTNVAKRRPGGDDFSSFYRDPKKRTQPSQELLWWRQLLIAELSRYRPNLVVACGNEALRALTSCDGITKWQGSVLFSDKIEGLKVIPVVHPAFIMRDNWEYYYISNTFFKRIKVESVANKRLISEPPDEFIIEPSIEQIMEWLSHIQMNSNLEWFYDIETTGDTYRCFGLWVEDRPNKAICVPLQDVNGPHWTVAQEAQIWRGLSLAMRDNSKLSNQNLCYDIEYSLDMGCEPSGFANDPMIGMNVAYPEFAKGLDFTTALFTNYEYYTDEGKTWKLVWTYNCKDMVATPKVAKRVTAEINEAGLQGVYEFRSKRFLPIAIEMQRNRLRLHRGWHQKLAGFLADERVKKHQELMLLIGRDINVKSSPQIQELLYDEMRLPKKHKRGGNVTVDENALKLLRAQNPNIAQLNLILEERHLRTKESNYINVVFDNDSDGELYLGYQTCIPGAKTSRWSFSKSPKWRGSSPQTISKIMRLMYQPPKGNCFWQRDLSQAEARIVAWLSDCKFLLKVFESPIKIHRVVGGMIFKTPPEQIEDGSVRYDISKRIVHAYDYMMQALKLATTANVPLAFAQEVMQLYGALVPEIPEWHQRTKEEVFKRGRLVTPMGRIRQCYKACSAITHTGQLPDEILRDLVSWIPQGTVPDILNEGMWKCWNQLDWVFWHQQGHDSYLASGKPERTQEFFEISEQAADVHFNINGRDCFIPGEFQWGYLWGAMLKYKPGEDTSYEAWKERATKEEYFDEAKIKERLYSMN